MVTLLLSYIDYFHDYFHEFYFFGQVFQIMHYFHCTIYDYLYQVIHFCSYKDRKLLRFSADAYFSLYVKTPLPASSLPLLANFKQNQIFVFLVETRLESGVSSAICIFLAYEFAASHTNPVTKCCNDASTISDIQEFPIKV